MEQVCDAITAKDVVTACWLYIRQPKYSNTDSSILFEHIKLDRERPSKSFFAMSISKDIFLWLAIKVTGYSLLINIHEKILPSFSPCRNQLQHAIEATYNSTMSTI